MTEVSVFHKNPNPGGGSEAVCMHILDSLQSDYDIQLITGAEVDWCDANGFFGTSVGAIERQTVHRAGTSGTATEVATNIPLPFVRVAALKEAIEHRRWASRMPETGITISVNPHEVASDNIDLHYLHYPYTWEHLRGPKSGLYRRLAAYDFSSFHNACVIANSQWTAQLCKDVLGTTAEVINPPVRTQPFSLSELSQNTEQGFVAVGRVVGLKNIIRSIDILRKVRQQGHDIHLHIIGPQPDSEYLDQVKDIAKDNEWLCLEGKLPRDELIRMLTIHRYGIHGHDAEHFGVGIAEMVAAGVLPFVPAAGGQREIVNNTDGLLYGSEAEAVDKISKVLSDASVEQTLREKLPDIEERYGVERFNREIRSAVADLA